MLAILGPNGVGKTTLMNLLTGVLYPSLGSISINNIENPYNYSLENRSMFGTMYPISGVYLKMTAYEYLAFVGALYGLESEVINNRIETLAADLMFSNELHREIKKYSSGTKKKIEFCAAVIANPTILYLDEPFESIDPKTSYEIKAYLKEYVRNGGTFIITSHILDTIQNLCTRYIILNNGQIVHSEKIIKNTDLEKKYMEVISNE